MKKITSFYLAAIATFLFSFCPLLSELPIGSSIPNPDVKMKDISGNELSFKDAKKENGLLVMFTCNTCPVVMKNQERAKEVCKLAQQKGIGVILLNSNEASRDDGDSFEDMKTYAKEQGFAWAYVVDKNSAMADAFSARRTPENFLFDKNLKLVYHGAIDDNPGNASAVVRKYLEEAINEMLTGKEVTIKETRSIGCGIKRL
ncbi:MAG: thioredoxin family protein [Bacteroidetes bacterium]|nr:thioredoxin family protein [Bacteroidota bacterium]